MLRSTGFILSGLGQVFDLVNWMMDLQFGRVEVLRVVFMMIQVFLVCFILSTGTQVTNVKEQYNSSSSGWGSLRRKTSTCLDSSAFWLYKVRETSWLSVNLLESQKLLCFMQLSGMHSTCKRANDLKVKIVNCQSSTHYVKHIKPLNAKSKPTCHLPAH
jgi:hypothetical protein